jgi:hypothetical protein
MIWRILLAIGVHLFVPLIVTAQQLPWQKIYPKRFIFPAVIIDGDTIPVITLPTLVVYPQRILGNDRISREYIALAQKVRKVYPYARLAVRVLNEINDTIAQMDKDRARRRYIKEYEKALLSEYKAELVKMKVSEGRILVKLIDRETGKTSYELVEQMRGSVSAMFWQGLARLFGETLKVNYDPKGKDAMIEEIVVKIEQGKLEPIPLPKTERKKGT